MKYLLLSVFCLHVIQVNSLDKFYNTRELNRLGKPEFINWVSIKDIEKSLKGKPSINVGFDVDDTVLHTSPVVFKVVSDNPGVPMLKIPDLWEKLNCEYVKFSMPKEIGKALIDFHKKRGDNIYFITARYKSPCVIKGDYSLDHYLQDIFNLKNMNPVIYTGIDAEGGTKSSWLKRYGVQVYYGDHDHDIEAAREAGILGVRVMRASNSMRLSGNRIGYYNELVLNDSDY